MPLSFLQKVSWVIFDLILQIAIQAKGGPFSRTKIDAAIFYLHTIKSIRQMFLSATFLGIGVMFFANMVLLFQISILFYGPWQLHQRILSAAGVGVLFFLIPVFFLLRIFSQKKWMQNFNGNQALEFALGKDFEPSPPKSATSP